MKNELIKLANELDRRGLFKEADYIDTLVKKAGPRMVAAPGPCREERQRWVDCESEKDWYIRSEKHWKEQALMLQEILKDDFNTHVALANPGPG